MEITRICTMRYQHPITCSLACSSSLVDFPGLNAPTREIICLHSSNFRMIFANTTSFRTTPLIWRIFFVQTAVAGLTARRNGLRLLLPHTDVTVQDRIKLPEWVPEWSCLGNWGARQLDLGSTKQQYFAATAYSSPVTGFGDGHSTLRIAGVRVTVIHRLLPRVDSFELTERTRLAMSV
jgi:hypothetical protein